MSKKILLVEDDEGILDAIKMTLEIEGYEVKTIVDGTEVYNLREGLPDLLLLDVWLSGIDGRTICRHLKSQEWTQNMPIILMSASRDTERAAREAGADDFLAKPFELEDLIAMVGKYA